MNRVTTEQNEFIATTSDSYVDLYETYEIEIANQADRVSDYKPQILRYHMMSFMPDTIPSADDPSEAKLVMWDLRLKDEVMQWPLHDCGNGAVNATAFEECDYTGDPNPTVDSAYIY